MKKYIKKIKKYFKSIWWYNHPIYVFYETITDRIPNFILNLWYFRKPLYNFRWWDYTFTLEFLRYSLNNMSDNLETKGNEVEHSKMKKVLMIRRCSEIIKHIINNDFIELAESELGATLDTKIEFIKNDDSDTYTMVDNSSEEVNKLNEEIFKKAHKLEEEYWNELWDIIKGNQNYKNFDPNIDFDEQFNGTGMKNWWD